MPEMKDYDKMAEEFKKKIASQMAPEPAGIPEGSVDTDKISSREYDEFRKDLLPRRLSLYEKGCGLAERVLKMPVSEKNLPAMEEAIKTCHLDVTPTGVNSFSYLFPLAFIVAASVVSFILFQDMFFIIFFALIGLIMIGPLGKLPFTLSTQWRMKASNQMVLCIFYMVTYMRHTSNFELAVRFAADHIGPPLSLDLRKVIWDVETEQFSNISDSMDSYLKRWQGFNDEFIESVHLIESSLYETSEDRRVGSLDKSLTVMLEGTYEKMLHYAQNLKSPLTIMNMLGIVLPILGLVILPLVLSFMEGVEWFHVMALYNIGFPAAVFFLGKKILSTRPAGYGDTDISEYNPEMKKQKKVLIGKGNLQIGINPLYFSLIVLVIFLIIGYTPLILHFLNPGLEFDYCTTSRGDGIKYGGDIEGNEKKGLCLLDYREITKEDSPNYGQVVGPFGLGSSLFSILVVLGIGLCIGIFFKLTSGKVMEIRNRSKQLEQEFASALFTLGNRLGDGLPAEIAFSKVADSMPNSVSGKFFKTVSNNITRLGLGVEQAVFNVQYGALKDFPSSLVESSMKVLVESAKKGPQVAASALINISNYIKEMHKVDERLKDLLSDTISSLKAQINFMTPAIAGIVIGITSMVTFIMGQLTDRLAEQTSSDVAIGGVFDLFGYGVPTFYFQIVVGVYVIQLIYIISVLVNGIENGADKLGEQASIGKNEIKAVSMYCFIAGVVILLFNFLAFQILSRTMG